SGGAQGQGAYSCADFRGTQQAAARPRAGSVQESGPETRFVLERVIACHLREAQPCTDLGAAKTDGRAVAVFTPASRALRFPCRDRSSETPPSRCAGPSR